MSKTKELFEAIYSNKIENVKRALSEGAEINGVSEQYGSYTPLMAAAGAWNTGILEFLVDQGADVKVKTPEGDTILSIMVGQAFSSGTRINGQYHNLIGKIISKGVDVDSYNQNTDRNPLLVSMSAADVETVDMLIDAGANLNIIVNKDHPDVPLNRAISQLVRMRPDAEYIIDKMIAKGANVNPKAENLRASPLSSAIVEGREDIFNKLIGHGADINHACSTTTDPCNHRPGI
jgi:ankyrin repeat protein